MPRMKQLDSVEGQATLRRRAARHHLSLTSEEYDIAVIRCTACEGRLYDSDTRGGSIDLTAVGLQTAVEVHIATVCSGPKS